MSLLELIKLNQCNFPVVYNGTPVQTPIERSLFPYTNHWHGNYKASYPIIDGRIAGYRKRLDNKCKFLKEVNYALPSGCFETAPYTQFPCYETGYGCTDSQGCALNTNQGKLCVKRYI